MQNKPGQSDCVCVYIYSVWLIRFGPGYGGITTSKNKSAMKKRMKAKRKKDLLAFSNQSDCCARMHNLATIAC